MPLAFVLWGPSSQSALYAQDVPVTDVVPADVPGSPWNTWTWKVPDSAVPLIRTGLVLDEPSAGVSIVGAAGAVLSTVKVGNRWQ
jgi:hypothetical protein